MKNLPLVNKNKFRTTTNSLGDVHYINELNDSLEEELYVIYLSHNNYDHDTHHTLWFKDWSGDNGETWCMEGIVIEWEGDPFKLRNENEDNQ